MIPENTTRRLVLIALSVGLIATGCRQDMHDAPRFDPYEASAMFADGASARPLPPGTVARGHLREDRWLYEGKDENGQLVTAFPMLVTREVLERGHERFEIYCSPCHDSLGTGNGMIVRRGFKRPVSYHDERLRQAPVGYFYDVMTHGFGVMSSYAAQVSVEDRWAIAAYVRVLQTARNQRLAELPASQQKAFRDALAAPAGAGGHGAGEHEPQETHHE